MKAILFYFILLLSICTYAQASVGYYTIDKKVAKEVDPITYDEGEVHVAKLSLKVYNNDSLEYDTETDTIGKIDVYMISSENGDTMIVDTYAGIASGFKFLLKVYKDSYSVLFTVFSEDVLFSFKKNDERGKAKLDVPCASSSLVLSNQPEFIKDEVARGILDFSSADFYTFEKGEEVKCKFEIKTWFKTGKIKEED